MILLWNHCKSIASNKSKCTNQHVRQQRVQAGFMSFRFHASKLSPLHSTQELIGSYRLPWMLLKGLELNTSFFSHLTISAAQTVSQDESGWVKRTSVAWTCRTRELGEHLTRRRDAPGVKGGVGAVKAQPMQKRSQFATCIFLCPFVQIWFPGWLYVVIIVWVIWR